MDRIQLRRDTSARWAEINPILLEGEVGFEIDTKLRKIGDGVTRWNDLEYLRAEGISQETGNSQNITMSQDAITREFGELGSEVGGLVSFQDLNVKNGLLTDTGITSGEGNYVVIPIKGGDEITIVPNNGQSLYFVAKSFDENNASVIDNASGYTGRVVIGATTSFTAPTDAKYLIVARLRFEVDITPNDILRNGISLFKTTNKHLSEITNNISGINSDLINKINKVVVYGQNFIPKGKIKEGKYYAREGEPLIASGYYYSEPIQLSAGEYIFMSFKDVYGTNAGKVWVVNESGVCTKIVTPISEQEGLVKVSLPSGMYAFNCGNDWRYNNFMVIKSNNFSDYPSIYVPYIEPKVEVEEGVHLNETMLNDIKTYNPLSGKKLVLNGDSICFGAGFIGGYGKIIADNNGMQIQNIAISGGTVAYSGDARHCICRTMSNLDADADYIIIEGGVNDATLVNSGTISDGYSAALDDTKFYGAMESLCKQLITRYAGKKYGYILVHAANEYFANTTSKSDNKYKQAIEVLKKWGVPYLDLNIAVPPFGLLPEDNPVRVTYTKDGDGYHPNEAGYKKYYCDKIESWMKTL